MTYFRFWIPACLASMAFVTSVVFSFMCQSFHFEPIIASQAFPTIQFGLWYRQQTQLKNTGIGNSNKNGTYYVVRNTCVEMSDNIEIDSHWKTARAFSVITLILSGFMIISLWFIPCFTRYSNPTQWTTMACMFMTVITMFQGLTFLFVKSNMCTSNMVLLAGYKPGCQWDSGATTGVVSMIMYFITGIVMLGLGAPKMPPRPPPESQTVTYEQHQLADGTTTVSEVQVIKGVSVPQPPESPAV